MNAYFSIFIGKRLNVDVSEMQIMAYTDKSIVRICRPDSMITKEYNPLRVNIYVDDLDYIINITIG